MKDIRDDGSLPLEIARGRKALHYHLFSAAPLAMLASILEQKSPKLKRLVDFAFRALTDPTQIGKMVGAIQDKSDGSGSAWMEIY